MFIVKMGYLPNSATYNAIVQEVLKQNKCRETELLLKEMVNSSFFNVTKVNSKAGRH